MKTILTNILSAKRNPIFLGVFTMLAVIVIGFGIAFATGIAHPAQTHADDLLGGDGGGYVGGDPGSLLGDNGGNGDYGGFGDLGGLGGYDNGGDQGLITPPTDTEAGPCNCVDTPPVVSPPDDTQAGPCNCDNTPPVVTPPDDTEAGPCNCDTLPPVIAPPDDTEAGPCNCDTPPPVIDVPPVDVPPVIIPPVIIPPVITPPPIIPPPPPPPAECISLTGTPHEISPGQAVTLAWRTDHATSITIDQGIGPVSPVAGGSIIVHPTTSTTYIATVTNAVNSVHCQTSVVVVNTPPPPPAPACIQLTANATQITPGQPVILNWVTSNASSISINNGVGSVTPVPSGSVTVYPTGNTTYTATVPGAAYNPACSVRVTVVPVVPPPPPPPPPPCTYNCGGGGGTVVSGGGFITPPPTVTTPASYVYLSQIPYTGLDLGPVGTIVYWTLLALWCLAAAYLVIFQIIPFLYRRIHLFGTGVGQMLNQPSAHLAMAGAASAVAPTPSYVPAPVHTTVAQSVTTSRSNTPANPSAYSAVEGFKSFAKNDALTIDDIVNGLARLPETQAPQVVPAPGQVIETRTVTHEVVNPEAPVYAPVAHAVHQATPRQESPAAAISTDVRDFVGALLNGNRDTVFATIRQIVREGGDAEAFMTQVVCALDDAYRGRIENTKVNPEIARLTQNCATPFLERLTAALTNAVDSSYSPGVTGSKLALTRALGVVEG